MRKFINKIKAQVPAREEGQGVVEYAVVLGVLVVTIILAFNATPIGTGVTNAVNAIVGQLP